MTGPDLAPKRWSDLEDVVRRRRTGEILGTRSELSPRLMTSPATNTGESQFDIASFIERGHYNVIQHYRRVLNDPRLTLGERAHIEARIAEENEWFESQTRSARGDLQSHAWR